MSNRRDIHDYLDGSLEPGREDELFKDIGSSEELRREFSEQFEIHRTAKQIAASVSVPAAAREDLFKKLEITNSPDIPLSIPGSNTLLKTTLYISAFVGAIIFGALRFSHDSTVDLPAAKITANREDHVKNEQLTTRRLQPQTASFIDAKSFKNKIPSKPEAGFLKASLHEDPVKKAHEKTTEVAGNPQQILTGIQSVPAAEHAVLKTADRLKTDFLQLSISALEEFFEQPVRVQFHSDAAFKNLSASALYEVSAADKFGVEFGYEEFRQSYSLTIEDEKTEVSRTQKLPVFSIAYRRSAPEISFKTITPFVQLNAGATSEGGLLKSAIGVEIPVFDGANFMLGAEAAAMPFKKQNTWYYSQKINAVFGVSVGF